MRKSTRSFLVTEAEAGSRLDRYLSGALGASRAQVRKLLARGGVAVDERVVGSSAKGVPLAAGSRIEVASFRPPASQRPIPDPEAPLVILAEGTAGSPWRSPRERPFTRWPRRSGAPC